LASVPSPLQVSTIDDKLREKLVTEFQHMRNHASGKTNKPVWPCLVYNVSLTLLGLYVDSKRRLGVLQSLNMWNYVNMRVEMYKNIES